jgi:hypothetical protein
MQKKSKEKLKNIHKKVILDRILIASSPATALEKGACWRLIVIPKFVWICKRTNPRRSQGTLLPLIVRTQGIESVEQCAMQGFNLVKQRNSF